MTRISGNKKLKRQMAPKFWGINRKNKRFVITIRPGSHKKKNSIPLAVLIRDKLKFSNTLKEAKYIIYNGKITIDGKIRKSLHHGVGVMDVMQLENIHEIYRMVPLNGNILEPIQIQDDEKSKKIIKVTNKTTLKKKLTQFGFHDGRTILTNENINMGDSCLINTNDKQKILEVLKLEKNCKILIIRGINAGKIGTVLEIKKGTFLLPKRVIVKLEDQQIEIPIELAMVVGKTEPVLKVK